MIEGKKPKVWLEKLDNGKCLVHGAEQGKGIVEFNDIYTGTTFMRTIRSTNPGYKEKK